MLDIQHAAKRALIFLNALHHKDAQTFAKQFLAPGDQDRWQFMDVLPGAVIVKDSQKLITMHDDWFVHHETAFKPYVDKKGLDRPFLVSDFLYCESIAGLNNIVRCGVNAYVRKEKNLGEGARELITTPVHLSLIFVFDRESDDWWVYQINNTTIAI